jgi:hypothetical protein
MPRDVKEPACPVSAGLPSSYQIVIERRAQPSAATPRRHSARLPTGRPRDTRSSAASSRARPGSGASRPRSPTKARTSRRPSITRSTSRSPAPPAAFRRAGRCSCTTRRSASPRARRGRPPFNVLMGAGSACRAAFMRRPVRIANCSGFYGDRAAAAREMVEGGPDRRAHRRLPRRADHADPLEGPAEGPGAGYARTFLSQFEQVIGLCLDRGITIVVNAGGLNPCGLADRLREIEAVRPTSTSYSPTRGTDAVPGQPGRPGGPALAGLRRALRRQRRQRSRRPGPGPLPQGSQRRARRLSPTGQLLAFQLR